jgi:hypothetical protein
LNLAAVAGGVELPQQLVAIDVGFEQQPIIGIIGELEIDLRYKDRGI